MSLDHCTVQSTGFGTPGFQAAGNELVVTMTRDAGELPAAPGAEQMVALLEGRALLVCGDERHELAAGEGILVPANLACEWQATEPSLFYRVARR